MIIGLAMMRSTRAASVHMDIVDCALDDNELDKVDAHEMPTSQLRAMLTSSTADPTEATRAAPRPATLLDTPLHCSVPAAHDPRSDYKHTQLAHSERSMAAGMAFQALIDPV